MSKLAPIWTMHQLNYHRLTAQAKRRNINPWTHPKDFEEFDLSTVGTTFVKNEDISWDRGHLVPNSDLRTRDEKQNSFSVINRTPQLAPVNRGAWRCVENALRNVLTTKLKDSNDWKYPETELLIMTQLEYDDKQPTFAKEAALGVHVQIPKSYNKIVIVHAAGQPASVKEAFCITMTNSENEYKIGQKVSAEGQAQPKLLAWNECSHLTDSEIGIVWEVNTQSGNFYNDIKQQFWDDNKQFKCTSSSGVVLSCDIPQLLYFSHKKQQNFKKQFKGFAIEFTKWRCPKNCERSEPLIDELSFTVLPSITLPFRADEVTDFGYEHESIMDIFEFQLTRRSPGGNNMEIADVILYDSAFNYLLDYHDQVEGTVPILCPSEPSTILSTAHKFTQPPMLHRVMRFIPDNISRTIGVPHVIMSRPLKILDPAEPRRIESYITKVSKAYKGLAWYRYFEDGLDIWLSKRYGKNIMEYDPDVGLQILAFFDAEMANTLFRLLKEEPPTPVISRKWRRKRVIVSQDKSPSTPQKTNMGTSQSSLASMLDGEKYLTSPVKEDEDRRGLKRTRFAAGIDGEDDNARSKQAKLV
jgi:hypothetical protein